LGGRTDTQALESLIFVYVAFAGLSHVSCHSETRDIKIARRVRVECELKERNKIHLKSPGHLIVGFKRLCANLGKVSASTKIGIKI
jgi:hypothetical protein